MSQQYGHSSAAHALDAYAVPAMYSEHDAGGWANSVLARSSAGPRYASLAQPTWQPQAMSASGFMFGSAQEPAIYRSALAPRAEHQQGFNPLAQPEYQARAVATELGPRTHQWFQPEHQQTHYGGFDGFASAHKQPLQQQYQDSFPVKHHSMQELTMPRLESLVVSAPLAALPAMPLYVESTCFSLATEAMQPSMLWSAVRQQLAEAGVLVANEKHNNFQLTCSSTFGASCSEFRVSCFDGHYRDCGVAPTRKSCYTVEFQRRAGCCLGFMQLFRHVLLALTAQVALESPIAVEASAPIACGEESIDMADVDMAALAMPTLARADNAAASPMAADSSLYESLLDFITSNDSASQITGMNSLALCLDGSHPQAAQLLAEVAAKLRTGQCEQVKQVAAKLLAQASATPSAAGAVIKHCLPLVLAQLATPTTAANSTADPLSATFTTATQKSLLRSCVSLASSDARAFQGAFDVEGSVVVSSRFRRELLRMSASPEAEVRQLAVQAIHAIQV